MSDFIKVITGPIKKAALLLFQLPVGNTNMGNIIIAGLVFALLIGIITHSSASGRITSLIGKIRHRKDD